MMKAYLWRGDHVLKNWGTGTVLVLAESVEAAWLRLRTEDFRAWAMLYHGLRADNQAELEEPWPFNSMWKRPEPKEYELDKLPVVVQWGSS